MAILFALLGMIALLAGPLPAGAEEAGRDERPVTARAEVPEASRQDRPAVPNAAAAPPAGGSAPAPESGPHAGMPEIDTPSSAAPASPQTGAAPAPTKAPEAEVPPKGIAAFIAAYPDHLDRIDGDVLLWKDGTRMPLADLGLDEKGNPLRALKLEAEDPALAASESVSAVEYEPIYLKMYGDCRAEAMDGRLAPVRWNKGAPDDGVIVMAARVNGVADALQKVSDELDTLSGTIRRYLRPLGGTYNCRNIALSNRRSLHGFGVAVDINPAHGDYWLTAATDANGQPIRQNRIPPEIVEVFERHGFVWGGRWNRFDTFHFEYRPEYLIATNGRLPERLTRETFIAGLPRSRTGMAMVMGPNGTLVPLPSPLPRMSYAPRAAAAPKCVRWVRQPGPSFGRCLGAPISPTRAAKVQRGAVR